MAILFLTATRTPLSMALWIHGRGLPERSKPPKLTLNVWWMETVLERRKQELVTSLLDEIILPVLEASSRTSRAASIAILAH